jgi:glycosyltransferase involved in cell wall biosynthesis
MLKAFPNAPLYTSFYQPDGTFPEFRSADVRPLPLDHIGVLRRHHRLALPLLAPAFSHLTVDAEVVLCSSSGWAHGVRATGRKVVYCYAPAHWLYQGDRYLGSHRPLVRNVLYTMTPYLRAWDRRAAASAHRYVTQSTVVRDQIRDVYGIDADVLPGPYRLTPDHPRLDMPGIVPGFFLCVARLLPYKNVDVLMAAFSELVDDHLVIVGSGPEAVALKRRAPANVRFVGTVSDEELAWLYSKCAGIVTASYEDYGLTPLEAAAFGKPSVALRWGGFVDTVDEGKTGVFFDSPTPTQVRVAIRRLRAQNFDAAAIREHAARYSEEAFVERLRSIVTSEMSRPPVFSAPGRAVEVRLN